MAQEHTEQHFETWFSSYGLLTAERVLAYFSIKIPHQDMVELLSRPTHALHRVLRVPLLSVFNGIIFQQAYDYQVYAQKLMIDYRLSPEYAKEPDAPGANVREDLDEQYQQLLAMTQAFTEHQYQHYELISESQSYLIARMAEFRNPIQDVEALGDDDDFNEVICAYYARAEEITLTFKSYRRQFYDMILAMSERLASLSDYQFDAVQAEKERESLFFDRSIGELS